MGQGRKNKTRTSDHQIEFRPRIHTESGAGTSVEERKLKCVVFPLEDCTLLAERIYVNEHVFGDFSQPRITILNEIGVIGYVPATFSKPILEKIAVTGGSIHGVVVECRPPRFVTVELCT